MGDNRLKIIIMSCVLTKSPKAGVEIERKPGTVALSPVLPVLMMIKPFCISVLLA